MSQDDGKEMTIEQIMSLIDKLTPTQQEKLRYRLNSKVWTQNVQEFVGSDFSRGTSETWHKLIERLESGNIDQDIKKATAKAWQEMMSTLGLSSDESSNPIFANSEDENVELRLEMAYLILQDKIAQAKQSIEQAIAVERQLEQELSFLKAQAIVWVDRASDASQQANELLAEHARRRHSQYLTAATAINDQLKEQKTARALLQQKLIELEG
jgi:hypothetical protein